jgi:ribose 5-phosphate isomerase B
MSAFPPHPFGIASDHAGYEMKKQVADLLHKKGVTYVDYGTHLPDPVSYATYGHLLAGAIERAEISFGIALCGSGNGINMTLNNHAAIRSALCWNPESAQLARAHNDANVLALPARFLSPELLEPILDAFLHTPFEGGRHLGRIADIPCPHP